MARGRHQGSSQLAPKKPPVGPSSASSAKRIAIAAPWGIPRRCAQVACRECHGFVACSSIDRINQLASAEISDVRFGIECGDTSQPRLQIWGSLNFKPLFTSRLTMRYFAHVAIGGELGEAQMSTE
jgi:hypothetical protein